MRTNPQSGLNVIEVMVFVAWVGMGVCFSAWWGQKSGWIGYVLGFLLGAGAGLGLCFALFYLAAYLFDGIWPGNSSVPVCKNGKCRAGHYEIHKLEDNSGKKRFDWLCRCGGRYHKKDGHFYEVLPDGSLAPYMKWKVFRGWFPEKI